MAHEWGRWSYHVGRVLGTIARYIMWVRVQFRHGQMAGLMQQRTTRGGEPMSKLVRQDLQVPDREAGRARRRQMMQREHGEESLPDEAMAAFLLEQEIQPTVGHEPRAFVRVPLR